MEIRIIDEKNGNPFEYFPKEGIIPDSPRFYQKQENIQRAMGGLLAKIDLDSDIDCLEIGAGHNPRPSQALSNLGARVITLDADWEPDRHTNLAEVEAYKRLEAELGKELMIPRVAGRNGNVTCYLGDIAFLRDIKSELKDKRFDLIYFWGSLNGTGICSSVEDASTPEELGINISFSERLLPVVDAIKDNGTILVTKPHFSGYMRESEEYVGLGNGNLSEIALYYALGSERKAKSIGIFVQTVESVMKRLGITNLSSKPLERLLEDPFERKIKNGWYSVFGKDNNYQNLRNILGLLSLGDREKFKNLSLVDAVYIGY